MPTLRDVEDALASAHPKSGVIISDDRFRTLAYRPPAERAARGRRRPRRGTKAARKL